MGSAAMQRNKVEWNSTPRGSETDQSKQNCVQSGSETEEICINCPTRSKAHRQVKHVGVQADLDRQIKWTVLSPVHGQCDSDVLYAATHQEQDGDRVASPDNVVSSMVDIGTHQRSRQRHTNLNLYCVLLLVC